MTIFQKILRWTALPVVCLFLLTGCDKEPKTISIATPEGSLVKTTVDMSDDFDMENTEGILVVSQNKKIMLRLAIIDEEARQGHLDRIKNTNMAHIYSQSGRQIVYNITDNRGLLNYRILPIADHLYMYGETYLPKASADKVWSHLTFEAEGNHKISGNPDAPDSEKPSCCQ